MRATEWVLVVPQFLIVLVVAAIFGADLRLSPPRTWTRSLWW